MSRQSCKRKTARPPPPLLYPWTITCPDISPPWIIFSFKFRPDFFSDSNSFFRVLFPPGDIVGIFRLPMRFHVEYGVSRIFFGGRRQMQGAFIHINLNGFFLSRIFRVIAATARKLLFRGREKHLSGAPFADLHPEALPVPRQKVVTSFDFGMQALKLSFSTPSSRPSNWRAGSNGQSGFSRDTFSKKHETPNTANGIT